MEIVSSKMGNAQRDSFRTWQLHESVGQVRRGTWEVYGHWPRRLFNRSCLSTINHDCPTVCSTSVSSLGGLTDRRAWSKHMKVARHCTVKRSDGRVERLIHAGWHVPRYKKFLGKLSLVSVSHGHLLKTCWLPLIDASVKSRWRGRGLSDVPVLVNMQ